MDEGEDRRHDDDLGQSPSAQHEQHRHEQRQRHAPGMYGQLLPAEHSLQHYQQQQQQQLLQQQQQQQHQYQQRPVAAQHQPASYPRQFLTMKEYKQEGEAYTKARMDELLSSPEYKAWNQTCTTCGACWFQEQFTEGCEECGGYAMVRPCPICDGQCGGTWRRSVAMSKSNKSAFWDGQCGLPAEQQQLLLLRQEEGTLDDVASMMEDISTSHE